MIHGVGMCDEYPRVNPIYRGTNPYDGPWKRDGDLRRELHGSCGERDGVKLEQQVLVTGDGYEMLTNETLSPLLDDGFTLAS
ncbi:MAG: hypothetical protein CM1200mP20_10060 [Pseudomonadota bacterium]|nr:MAG: hypothetical protein CM1200mP20_10060 [Pseudomonadota bacterium]